MATPRTNAEIAAYWAEGLRDTEPRSLNTRTMIDVTDDVIYSYGRHFPMAKIIRDSKGTAREVIFNTDSYHSRGFTTTADHQWDVRSALMGVLDFPSSHFPTNIGAVEAQLKNSRRRIIVTCVPLTSHQSAGTVYAVEDPADPRPTPAHELHRTIPAPWDSVDPGPPPVDEHPEQCIAGTREEYSYEEKTYYSSWNAPPRGAVPDPTNPANYVLIWHNGVIEYGKAQYPRAHLPGVSYKQCPHCAVFQPRYERWRRAFYGDPWGRGRGKGYQAFSEYVRTYGSVKAWREAGRANFREVREGRAAWDAWVERNTLPFADVPVRNGRPVLNAKGEASRNALLQSKRKQRRILRETAERRAREAKAAAERMAREKEEREERMRRITAAREAFEAGLEFEVPHEIGSWCASNGIAPNDDGTITLVKCVEPDYHSAHGAPYEPDTVVIDSGFEPNGRCGNGLHFSPTPREARSWVGRHVHEYRYMQVRVPILDLNVVDQGSASKIKAPHCYVVRELTSDEVTKLDSGGAWM